MRKGLFSILFLLLFIEPMVAQQRVLSYSDSVKQLFRDIDIHYLKGELIKDNPEIDHGKFDGTVYINSSFFQKHRKGEKIYKYASKEGKKQRIDSIFLSANEFMFVKHKMTHANGLIWNTDFFPSSTITSQDSFDSFYSKYDELGRGAGTIVERYKYNEQKYESDTLYRAAFQKIQKLQKDMPWKKGTWKIGPPVFLKKGRIAIVYTSRYCCQYSASYSVMVYKKEKDKWSAFGAIDSGNMN